MTPMKRGLLLHVSANIGKVSTSPKDDPDEKGIVTHRSSPDRRRNLSGPKDDPDEKGIVTLMTVKIRFSG